MAHRATTTMLRLRREKVHRLRSLQYTADEIYNALKEEFQDITLATIYNDIKYLKKYSKAYITLEYIPDFGDEFAQAKTLIDWALGEAVTTYYHGREEIHNITLPDGRQTVKHVKKLRDLRALALIAQIGVLKVKFGWEGPVVANINTIVEENRRLQGITTRRIDHTASLSSTCNHMFDDRGKCIRCTIYSREHDTNAVF